MSSERTNRPVIRIQDSQEEETPLSSRPENSLESSDQVRPSISPRAPLSKMVRSVKNQSVSYRKVPNDDENSNSSHDPVLVSSNNVVDEITPHTVEDNEFEVGASDNRMDGGSKRENAFVKRLKIIFGKCWTALPASWTGEKDPELAFKYICMLFGLVLLAFSVLILPWLLILISPDALDAPGPNSSTPSIMNDVRGTEGAVATESEVCAKLGVSVMRDQGGNSADALVVVALCQGIVSPFASGIGGGAFILVHDTEKSRTQFYDARETAPTTANANHFTEESSSIKGGKAVAVPGELAGLFEVHKQHGSLEWSSLVMMVIDIARHSKVSKLLGEKLQESKDKILQSPTFKNIFTKPSVAPSAKLITERNQEQSSDDTLPGHEEHVYQVREEGDDLEQHALADFLESVAHVGAEFLYTERAENISLEVQKQGGFMTHQDIKSYNVKKRDPIKSYYYGKAVLGAPPPSSGGASISMALNILEGLQIRRKGRNGMSFHLLVETFKFTFGKRMDLADPDFEKGIDEVVKKMTDKDFAMEVRKNISSSRTFPSEYYSDELTEQLKENGTLHISILDKNNLAIAMTSTINHAFGAGFLSDSCGFVFNNEMDDFSTNDKPNAYGLYPAKANIVKGKKRPLSSMSPTIVLDDGVPSVIVGASGGPRIITATLQTLVSLFDFGDDIATSITAPRLHHQLVPNSVKMEALETRTCTAKDFKDSGVTFSYWSSVCLDLHEVGHFVESTPAVGGVNGIRAIYFKDDDGESIRMLKAKSDPRKYGKASAY